MTRITLARLRFLFTLNARHAAVWTPSMAEEDITERIKRNSRSCASFK